MNRLRWAAGAAAVVVGLGAGLYGWHRHLDQGVQHPPAVDLSHGECRGTLGDPRFAASLGSTRQVRVDTTFIPGGSTLPDLLSCFVDGEHRRDLSVRVSGAGDEQGRTTLERKDVPADAQSFPGGEAGDRAAVVRFTCVTRSGADGTERTWYYAATAAVQNAQGNSDPAPGRQKTAELAVAFAHRAAEKALGCTNTVDLPDGPYAFGALPSDLALPREGQGS
ncbi:hypothetical protein AB0D10_25655 [Kitasatospora sp. NPDC048545]|uniref:hypothetical protein n=1 Tax=Kitasatospora sp. NPDC048545 TaxID=3157208 RepID=UPI0033C701AB